MIDISKYTETVQVMALCRFGGVTPRMFEVLLRHFKTVPNILLAETVEIQEIEGITPEVAEKIAAAPETLQEADLYISGLAQREIALVSRLDPNFPELLFELNDPPPMLYFRGRLPKPGQKTVSLIGTREASGEGIEMTSRLAREFAAAGVQIVSSLVGGIDSAAHLAGSTAGGDTFAVTDCGIDHISQAEGVPLAIDIIRTGGVVSEYPPDTEASDATMPQTNRILAGLAQAVVVTEVYGGSVRTLDLLKSCSEIGKMVFFMIDPERGAYSDEAALGQAMDSGAIPIEGYDRIGDIIKSLV
ncbi:MAG: DNA-processing protein DprA [bacterium]|nr:DNA-processing protein DprA [bacterium]